MGGYSSQGGAIYVSGCKFSIIKIIDSTLNVFNSEFVGNSANDYGGVIFASGFKGVNLLSGTRLTLNEAPRIGGDIYASNSKNNITV